MADLLQLNADDDRGMYPSDTIDELRHGSIVDDRALELRVRFVRGSVRDQLAKASSFSRVFFGCS
jgi:hypothetical protein